jgi:transposase InsO family protein
VQPLAPHEHWHTDVSYLNICGTFYSLCRVLDGCSRANLHWEIRESMTEPEVELELQKAKEQYPGTTPRLICDNGPQFIARDFKQFVRLSGMDRVGTSPYYPRSNGKIDRWHGSLNAEAVRPKTPLNLEDARRVVGHVVEGYDTRRLHSAIGYVTPHDRLAGRHTEIWEARDRKLEAARLRGAERREAARDLATPDSIRA